MFIAGINGLAGGPIQPVICSLTSEALNTLGLSSFICRTNSRRDELSGPEGALYVTCSGYQIL